MQDKDRALTAPITTVGGTEEEVLEDHSHKVPQDDLSTKERLVEGGNLAGLLAVVVGQTEDQKDTNTPKENGNRITDGPVTEKRKKSTQS